MKRGPGPSWPGTLRNRDSYDHGAEYTTVLKDLHITRCAKFGLGVHLHICTWWDPLSESRRFGKHTRWAVIYIFDEHSVAYILSLGNRVNICSLRGTTTQVACFTVSDKGQSCFGRESTRDDHVFSPWVMCWLVLFFPVCIVVLYPSSALTVGAAIPSHTVLKVVRGNSCSTGVILRYAHRTDSHTDSSHTRSLAPLVAPMFR